MKFVNNKAENVKIAYIGGGSRGWAQGLMSDLTVVVCQHSRMDVSTSDMTLMTTMAY